MKIYLVDVAERMTSCWKKEFGECSDVTVVHGDITTFLDNHTEIDTIVSAANSFGFMDGGLDGVYVKYFGEALQESVLQKIREEHFGEQPVGSSMIVEIPNANGKRLIHTPSMRVPQPLLDPRVVYTCTRSALVTAIRNKAKNVVLPAFGHLTGRVKAADVSLLMYKAYEDVCLRKKGGFVSSWEEVVRDCNIDAVLLGHMIYR